MNKFILALGLGLGLTACGGVEGDAPVVDETTQGLSSGYCEVTVNRAGATETGQCVSISSCAKGASTSCSYGVHNGGSGVGSACGTHYFELKPCSF